MADAGLKYPGMADTTLDTRTEGSGQHRQVVVLGDPSTTAGVAPVDATYGVGADIKRIAVGNNRPFLYDVAMGNITGASPVLVMGYNGDVDNTREDLWPVGGTYIFPSSAQQLKIVSSSTNDTSNGTGARTVDIHYLDSNYAAQTETITLNGTSAVNTVATNIIRINDMHVMTAGSTGAAVGNLSLTNAAGDETYGYISTTHNASRNAIYTVPAGYTLYIVDWQFGTGSNAGNRMAEFTLRVTTTHADELTPGVFHMKDVAVQQDGDSFTVFTVPIKCIAQSDIKISVISDSATANAICGGHFSGWLQAN